MRKRQNATVVSRWRTVLSDPAEAIAGTARRFPISITCLLLAALFSSLLIAEFDIPPQSQFRQGAPLAVGLVAAALAAFVTTLALEARRTRLWLRHLYALLAAAIALFIMWPVGARTTMEPAFILALVALAPVAPFVSGGGNTAFWNFGMRLGVAAVLAVLALLFCAGGLSAILASLTYLFGLGIPDDLYQHIWSVVGLFVAPLFGLSQIPRDFQPGPEAAEVAFVKTGMRALVDFAAAPLLLIYAFILHVYAVKIILVETPPGGQIGWLVLTYGACIFATLILAWPALASARKPTRLLQHLWPVLLPIPLVLLFYALYLRIGAFGLTQERYLLGLFGLVAATLAVLQIVPAMRGNIRLLAGLPALALLLASFGPHGATARSVASQAQRFLTIVDDAVTASPRQQGEALAALRFLENNGALTRVARDKAHDVSFQSVAHSWGLDPNRPVRYGDSGNFNWMPDGPSVLSVAGFDLVVPSIFLDTTIKKPLEFTLPSGKALSALIEGNELIIDWEGERFQFALPISDVEALGARAGKQWRSLTLHSRGKTIRFAPGSLVVERTPDPQIRTLQGLIMIRTADWR